MKTIIWLIIGVMLILVTNLSYSDEISKSKVPKVIIKSFEKEFKKVKNIHYGIETEGNKKIYQILYEKDKAFFEVLYNADGSQIQYEEVISPGDLPEPIIAYLMKNYVKFSFIKSAKIYRNKIFYGYYTALNVGKKISKLIFDKEGHFIKDQS
jgi:hypothetical protein